MKAKETEVPTQQKNVGVRDKSLFWKIGRQKERKKEFVY
jgi:hypothetical protein